MIPSPNLDDRTFQDIVDEAIRLIPQYCPEWTNHNPADPGITLIELFAWMTEMVLYRLNKVPDKNYLAFLDLMGVRLQPPQPARALLTFDVSDKADRVEVRRGTRVSTQPVGDQPAITFETASELLVVRNRIVSSFSRYRDSYRENTSALTGKKGEAFEVFGGVKRIERYLYVGDPSFANFQEPAILTLRFHTPVAGMREFPKMLEWEVWTGETWRELEQADILVERNSVAFIGPPEIATGVVNDIEEYWVRGRLVDVPANPDDTRVDLIQAKIEVVGDGVTPDHAVVNPEETFFKSVDLDKNFYPFDREPTVDTTFYVASEEFFSQPGAEIKLEFQLSDPSHVELPLGSKDLVLRWEYYNGKRWKLLGRAGALPEGTRPTPGFRDGTECLTTNGSVTFKCPDDVAPFSVNGIESHWIRCRIEKGNYGEKGAWSLQGDTWEWSDENPLRPPSVKALVIKYAEPEHALGKVLSYNDFLYTDFTTLAAKEFKDFQPFEPVAEDNPAFYVGFENAFPNDRVQVYFNVVGEEEDAPRSDSYASTARGDLVEQVVVWEYWNGKSWANLYPKDGTRNFSHSGFVEFVGPKDFRKGRRFGDNLYWIRARLEMGGYDQPPRVNRVLLNTVEAYNLTSYGETVLGSSNGTPNQFFKFPRGPVLDGEHLVVIEPERPHDAIVRALSQHHGVEAVSEVEDGFAVRWQRVDSFYESVGSDRHYTKDVVTGEIRFGDGVRGMIPPKGDRNVRAGFYQVGGGDDGNVPPESITILKDNIAYILGVTNPFAATGGSDLETIDEVRERGPHVLKSRNRAVTAEDFEWLAREASNSVARVKALPATDREGEVTVIVVPKVSDRQEALEEKPIPSTELLRRVKTWLDDRRLVTTRINVVKPRYLELSVEVTISRRVSGSSDRIKRDILRELHRFLHPLLGGRDSRGWPFGRSVYKVDLFHVVERVEGVDFVERVRIFRADRKTEVDQLRVREDQLPFLVAVEVTEKAHQSAW